MNDGSNQQRDRIWPRRLFPTPPLFRPRPPCPFFIVRHAVILFLLCLIGTAPQAQTVILHLKNGDRIAGTIVSEDTNRVVIATTWIKELPVPLSEIASREKVAAEAKPPSAPTPAA